MVTYIDNNVLLHRSIHSIDDAVATPGIREEFEYNNRAKLPIPVRGLNEINGRFNGALYELADRLYQAVGYEALAKDLSANVFDALDQVQTTSHQPLDILLAMPAMFLASVSYLTSSFSQYKFTDTPIERLVTKAYDATNRPFHAMFNPLLTITHKNAVNKGNRIIGQATDDDFFGENTGKKKKWIKKQLKKDRKPEIMRRNGEYSAVQFYNHNDEEMLTTAMLDASINRRDVTVMHEDKDLVEFARQAKNHFGSGYVVKLKSTKYGDIDLPVGEYHELEGRINRYMNMKPDTKIHRRVQKVKRFQIEENTTPGLYDTVKSLQLTVMGIPGVWAMSFIGTHMLPEIPLETIIEKPIQFGFVAATMAGAPYLALASLKSAHVFFRGLKPVGKVDKPWKNI
ncbi:MAG: hypothetical protein ACMXYF_01330 [Candidatus Woesearchaeota archaeon]